MSVCLISFSEGSDIKRCTVAWFMAVLCNLKNVPPIKTDKMLILTVGSMVNLCVQEEDGIKKGFPIILRIPTRVRLYDRHLDYVATQLQIHPDPWFP